MNVLVKVRDVKDGLRRAELGDIAPGKDMFEHYATGLEVVDKLLFINR